MWWLSHEEKFGAKNMQNLGRFYTASNVDCEYLGKSLV